MIRYLFNLIKSKKVQLGSYWFFSIKQSSNKQDYTNNANRLPTNSTVSFTSPTIGAQKTAIRKPVIIIGIPTPIVIRFEGMSSVLYENVYEVYDDV